MGTNMTDSRRRSTGFVLIAAACLSLSGVQERTLGAAVLTRQTGIDCRTGCEIELTRLVTLTDKNRALPDLALHVFRSASGRYLISSPVKKQVAVFDAQGIFERVITGQFRLLTNLVAGPKGSFLIFDPMARTLTQLMPDLTLGQAVPFAYKPAAAVGDRYYVIAQNIPTRELAGFPLHIADLSGAIVRSFGTDTPQYRPDLRLLLDRVVAPAADGTLWAMPPGKYVLEKWNPDTGKLIRQLELKSTWLNSLKGSSDPSSLLNSVIETIWESQGHVWVLGRIAAADSNLARLASEKERPFNIDEYDSAHDWILDVVDPVSARVVASRTFRQAHWTGATSQLLVSRRLPASAAAPQFDVFRSYLKTKGGTYDQVSR